MHRATVLTILALAAISILFLPIAVSAASSQTSQQISLSGRLLDSDGRAISSTVNMTFALYNAESGGNLRYTETHPSVTVTGGLWSVQLGSITPLNLFFNGPYYVQVTVNGETAGTRIPLTAAPYCRALGNFVFNSTTNNAISLSNLIMAADDGVFAVGGSDASDDPANIHNRFIVNLADNWLRSRLANNYFDGRLGIRTTAGWMESQGAGLYLNATEIGGMVIDNQNASQASTMVLQGAGTFFTPNSTWVIERTAGGLLTLAEPGLHRLIIQNSTGYVGIGTTNPSTLLDVDGPVRIFNSSGTTSSLQVGNYSANQDSFLTIFSDSGSHEPTIQLWKGNFVWQISQKYNLGNLFVIRDETNGKNAFVIENGTGNVGIGTTSPARTLHINDALRLEPISSAPSSPSLGDLYVDSDSSVLCFYDGSNWINVSGAGACA